MRTLVYMRTYYDDLLVIKMGTYDNCLDTIKSVLNCLRPVKVRVNVKKSSFALYEIKYLGYVLSCDSSKPQPEKAQLSWL